MRFPAHHFANRAATNPMKAVYCRLRRRTNLLRSASMLWLGGNIGGNTVRLVLSNLTVSRSWNRNAVAARSTDILDLGILG
jgi:hypothetical protein